MVDMMNAMISDLIPRDNAWHHEFGPGIIYNSIFKGKMCVLYRDALGGISVSANLAGWRCTETVKPGHVQVRVDDLDLGSWLTDEQPSYTDGELVAIRAAKADAARRVTNQEKK